MSTSKKSAGTEVTREERSKARLQSQADADIEDLYYAINLLKIRIHAATNVLEKIRYYNQIKSLEDSIDQLRSNGSSQ